MKNIIAILNHCIKLEDPAKQNPFCPHGENSWFKWQQDMATGTSIYKADDCSSGVFLELLRPTLKTLSDFKLLKRCVHGTLIIPINALILCLGLVPKAQKQTAQKSFILPLHLQPVISTEEQRAGLRSWTSYLSLLEITLIMLLALRTRKKKQVWKADIQDSVKEAHEGRKPFVK